MIAKPYREITHGDRKYPVYIAPGALQELSTIASAVSQARARFVVTSPAVQRLLGSSIGAETPILMDDSERDKSLATAERLIGELVRHGARRDSLLIAIGGGVIGDTAGFVASVYLRGIDLLHVPTTLLAQVDSSIGGKVAVNHSLGKNLVGSFYPPRAVVSDTRVLESLRPDVLRSGMFEALKAGVIGDPVLFEAVPDSPVQEIVERSVAVKADIVEADARESDRRRLLNYGHTIGHGIEAALDFEGISHGDAVAWGMVGANAIAARREMLSRNEALRINSAIFSMKPDRPIGITPDSVLAAIELDKKFTADRRVMVLPRRIGQCEAVDVTIEEIRYGVDAAMKF